MPSVVTGISEEVDDLLKDLVERGVVDTREEAARKLIEWAAHKKYDLDS